MKQYRSLVAAAACALALSACGNDGDVDQKAQASSSSLEVAEAVVVEYVGALYSGDASACDLESEGFSATQNEAVGAQNCTERVESIKALLTDGEPLFDMAGVVVEVSKDGEGAVAEVSHASEDLAGTYELVRAGGSWVINSEEAAAESAPQADAPDGGSYSEPRTVSDEEAVALARAFCSVEVGVARAQVEEWLGQPSAEGTDDDGQAEVDWFVNQDAYTVWFDDAEQVASYSSSTPREDDTCEE